MNVGLEEWFLGIFICVLILLTWMGHVTPNETNTTSTKSIDRAATRLSFGNKSIK